MEIKFETYDEIKLNFEKKYGDARTFVLVSAYTKAYLENGENGKSEFIKFINSKANELELNSNNYDSWKNFLKNVEFLSALDEKDQLEINSFHLANLSQFFYNLYSQQELSFGTKGQELLQGFLEKLNNDDPLRFIYEILQNADDCNYDPEENPNFELDLTDFNDQRKITFSYNEKGMSYLDVISICSVGESTKKKRMEKRLTGEKGIGFKTIFTYCNRVDINSGGYVFQLGGKNSNRENNSMFFPIQLNEAPSTNTKITLYLKEKDLENITNVDDIYQHLKTYFGIYEDQIDENDDTPNYNNAFGSCAVLFTNQLKSIKVKKTQQDSFEVSVNKEKNTITHKVNGKTTLQLSYFAKTFNVFLDYNAYVERYPIEDYDTISDTEYQKLIDSKDQRINYPIVMVAPIFDDNITHKMIDKGKMYSFLPTGTNINAPISIQLPIKLSQNRSTISDEELKWNKKMVEVLQDKCIPEFMEALRKEVGDKIFYYIPNLKNTESIFYLKYKNSSEIKADPKLGTEYLDLFRKFNYFGNNLSPLNVFMLDEFLNPYIDNCKDVYEYKIENKDENKTLIEYNQTSLTIINNQLGIDLQETINERAVKINKLLELIKTEDYEKYINLIEVIRSIYYIKNEDTDIKVKTNAKINAKTLPGVCHGLNIYPSLKGNSIEYVSFKDKNWLLSSKNNINVCDYEHLSIFNAEDLDKYSVTFEINLENYNMNDLKELIIFSYCSLDGNSEYTDKDLIEYLNDIFTDKINSSIYELKNQSIAKKIIQIYIEIKESQSQIDAQTVQFWLDLTIVANTHFKASEPITVPSPSEWSERTCDWLNKTTFDKDNIKPSSIIVEDALNTLTTNMETETFKIEIIETLKKNGYENEICVFVCSYLKVDFVRYPNQIILREINDEIKKDCTNSIIGGLHYMVEFNSLKGSLKSETKNNIKTLNKITLGAFCNSIFNNSSFDLNNSDNNVVYEILQNINDYVNNKEISIELIANTVTLKYQEETGFKPIDFYNISSYGNSGSKGCENKTGNFGTGFKSFYSKFKKVHIKSNGISCILDLTNIPNLDDEGKSKFFQANEEDAIELYKTAMNTQQTNEIENSEIKIENKKLPIPIFEEYTVDTATKNITTISLTRHDYIKEFVLVNEPVYNEVMFSERINENYAFFNNNEHLYFLKNINIFKVNGKEYNKVEYLKKNFYSYSQDTIEILFPKENTNISKIKYNSYVTLPLNEESIFSAPFYINFLNTIPNENRKSLNYNTFDFDKFSDAFYTIFNKFAKDNPTIAYKYFPYDWLNKDFVNDLKSIKFLRIVNDSKDTSTDTDKLASITDIKCDNKLSKFQYDNLANFPWKDDVKGFLYYEDPKFYDVIGNCINFDYIVEHYYYFNMYSLQNWLFSTNNSKDRQGEEITLNNGTTVKFNQIPHYDNDSSKIYDLNGYEKGYTPTLDEVSEWVYKNDILESICNTKITHMNNDNYSYIKDHLLQYFTNVETMLYKNQVEKGIITTDLLNELIKREENYFIISEIAKAELRQYPEDFLYFIVKDVLPIGNCNLELYSNRDVWYYNSKGGEQDISNNNYPGFLDADWWNILYTADNLKHLGADWDNNKWGNNKFKNLDAIISKGKFNDFPLSIQPDGDNYECTKSIVEFYLENILNTETSEKYSCNINWMWTETSKNFLPYFDIYQQKVLGQLKNLESVIPEKAPIFKFEEKLLSKLDNNIIQRCKDSITSNQFISPDDYKNKLLKAVLKIEEKDIDDNLNTFESILDDLLTNRICILKDSTVNKQLWTLGHKIVNNSIAECKFILFNEKALSKLIDFVFGCKSYSEVLNCTIYTSNIANKLFKRNYDEPPTELFDEKNIINEDLKKFLDVVSKMGTSFTQDKVDPANKIEPIKTFMEELQYKNYCFAGYGVLDEDKHVKCPLCKAKVLANATSMRLRHIIVFDKISIPVLFCQNCNVAAKYSKNYFGYKNEDGNFSHYLIKKEDDKEILLEHLRSNDKELTICFDMNNSKTTYLSFKPTVLHRLVILYQIYK